MDYIVIWFVMSGGFGYIPPQDVRAADMRCGIDGAVAGVKIDRVVNPSVVLWPDPIVAGQHCQVDISERVAGLPQGQFHIATTIFSKLVPFGAPVERYHEHDPHTSVVWMRDPNPTGLPNRATNLRLLGNGQ